MAASKKKTANAWIYALVVIIADQLSKFATVAFLPVMSRNALWYPYGGVGIFKNFLGIEFSIVHATNKGAAWSVFSDYQELLVAVRIVLIVAVIIYALFFNEQSKWQVPLALIIGGAVANVIDFFTYGYVIDMFHFVLWGYDYPVFNIADSAICIGIAWIFVLSLLGEGSSKRKKKRSKRRR